MAWWMPLVFTAPLVNFFLFNLCDDLCECVFFSCCVGLWVPAFGWNCFFYRAVEQGEKKGRVIIVGVGFPRAWRWVGLGNWVKQRGKSQRFVVLKHVAGRLC